MAQQRGRSQARRNGGGGGSGMPGWAWLVIGVLLTLGVVIGAPRLMKSRGGDSFFKPTPNPDAKAEPATTTEEVAPAPTAAAATAAADGAAKPDAKANGEDYSFYDVLPKNEVRLSDAQLAAMAQAEAKRKAAADKAATAKAATAGSAATANGLPQPIDGAAQVAKADAPKPVAAAKPVAKPDDDDTPPPVTIAHAKAADGASVPISRPVPATSDTPYLLQAGAFGDAGQAEAVKAKIAMLGLNARVESAEVGGKMVYRVRMGPYASASDLAGAKSKLSGSGLAAVAVKAR